MRRLRLILSSGLLGLLTSACGSSPSAPSAAATITIGPTGISPKDVHIKAWNFVTFVNNDARTHTMLSDPVDLHTQCPAVNRIGALLPGESRDTSTLNLAGTCGFHDHGSPSDPAYQGRIIVE
jgi:plastocyanin